MFRLPALIIAVLSAIIWAIIAVYGLYTHSNVGVYPAIISNIYIIISYSLYKMRFEAAIACLIISLIGLFYNYGKLLMFKDVVMLIIDFFAIKATVVYKTFKDYE